MEGYDGLIEELVVISLEFIKAHIYTSLADYFCKAWMFLYEFWDVQQAAGWQTWIFRSESPNGMFVLTERQCDENKCCEDGSITVQTYIMTANVKYNTKPTWGSIAAPFGISWISCMDLIELPVKDGTCSLWTSGPATVWHCTAGRSIGFLGQQGQG